MAMLTGGTTLNVCSPSSPIPGEREARHSVPDA